MIKYLELKETERSLLEYLLQRHIDGGSYFKPEDQHKKMCQNLLLKLERECEHDYVEVENHPDGHNRQCQKCLHTFKLEYKAKLPE